MLTFDTLPDKIKQCFTNNATVSVAFVKTDKTVRHMAFRKFLKSYVKSDKEKTELQKNVLQNNNLMRGYDTNLYIAKLKELGNENEAAKESYRVFKLENVLALMCGGQVFDFREENDIFERFGEATNASLTKSMVANMSRDVQLSESFLRNNTKSKIKIIVSEEVLKILMKG